MSADSSCPVPRGPVHQITHGGKGGDLLGGRYRLWARIAGGDTSDVWLARDEKLGRPVAVKITASHDGWPGSALVEHEARLLAALDHPGIIRALDVGQHEGLGFLVLPQLDGIPLDRLIDRLAARLRRSTWAPGDLPDVMVQATGRQPLVEADRCRTVVHIVVELLRAVESAHSRGVVHGNIEPGNVVLGAGGHPVLIDFGSGGRFGAPGASGTPWAGPPPRLVPEQTLDRGAGAGVQTDVHGLGLLLQAFLVPKPAHLTEDPWRQQRALDHGLPQFLAGVCRRATATESDRRYRSARAMRADLSEFLASC